MNQVIHFTDSKKLGEFLSSFPLCQGNLYHYTSDEAGENIINNNELWITRANDLLDDEEIKFGIETLASVATESLKDERLSEFIKLLESARDCIDRFYILCFAESPTPQMHKDIHGEFVLEFSFAIGLLLTGNGIHKHKIGDGYALNYTQDHFRSFEGYVSYEEIEQKRKAKQLCEIYNDGLNGILDESQFIDSILIFIMLTKRYAFRWEREYRIGFFTKSELNETIIKTSEQGKYRIHIHLPEQIEKFKKYDS